MWWRRIYSRRVWIIFLFIDGLTRAPRTLFFITPSYFIYYRVGGDEKRGKEHVVVVVGPVPTYRIYLVSSNRARRTYPSPLPNARNYTVYGTRICTYIRTYIIWMIHKILQYGPPTSFRDREGPFWKSSNFSR